MTSELYTSEEPAPEVTEETREALLATLRRHDALDLADMLLGGADAA